MTSRRTTVIWLLTAALAIGSPAAVAADADPDEVASAIADTGVYVESSTATSASRIGDLVGIVRAEGEMISFVVLADEPAGGSTTFADAVYGRSDEGVVVVVAPQTVGWSGTTEVFTATELDSALDAALDAATDTELLETFVTVLTGESAGVTGTGATSPGGGGAGWVWLLLIVGGAVVLFVVWRSRRRSDGTAVADSRLVEVREVVQEQVNAVANDLIDLEAEVGAADNPEADGHYRAAGALYTEVDQRFAAATTPEALVDLSNQLDLAIWHLDAAEAILDGKPVPEEPAPRSLPEPEVAPDPAAGTGQADPQGLPPRPDYTTSAQRSPTRPPYPDYDRRPQRRSSHLGPGLFDMLAGLAGTMMAGRAMSRGRRAGGILPRAGAPSRRSSSGTSSSSGAARRSTRSSVGRARGGGRRTRRRR